MLENAAKKYLSGPMPKADRGFITLPCYALLGELYKALSENFDLTTDAGWEQIFAEFAPVATPAAAGPVKTIVNAFAMAGIVINEEDAAKLASLPEATRAGAVKAALIAKLTEG
jgi:hypothetical protein